MNKELVLVTISGPDHPGITAELMSCICNSRAKIEDMGQSITHGLLSLSILIDVTREAEGSGDSPVIKDLLFTAKKMGMELEFEVIEDKERISTPGDKYILSCVSLAGITPDFLHDISKTLALNNINIQRIDNVTENEFKSLEIATRAQNCDVDWNKVKEELINLSNKHETDLALLKDDVWRRNKRLIVFDMDSTLIQSEVIVEMAKAHGVGDKVHEITERAMEGHLDFDQSLTERVGLLKGLREDLL
ncbi:MAG: ACT domain-containing protein, partial [Bacteriovoracaceae bacterium]